ncbi:cupin domain-containing protein [Pseudolysinimonas sp.]
MEPFAPRDALAIPLDRARVADGQRVAGDPSTGFIELAAYRSAEVGVWEMTAGAMRDVEADEVFVVLSGSATVELLEGERVVREIALGPGSLCRLEAGMSTRWTVTEALRKLYVTGEPA